MIIEFPNSPGIEVAIERGGRDPITDEVYPDQYVQFRWIDENGNDNVRGFLGP